MARQHLCTPTALQLKPWMTALQLLAWSSQLGWGAVVSVRSLSRCLSPQGGVSSHSTAVHSAFIQIRAPLGCRFLSTIFQT